MRSSRNHAVRWVHGYATDLPRCRAKAWLEWNRERSYRRTVAPGAGAVLTSTSTLRFRHREEVAASLAAAGYAVDQVRQAPDRPGLELVFVARALRTLGGAGPW